jgi:hypothetical protein
MNTASMKTAAVLLTMLLSSFVIAMIFPESRWQLGEWWRQMTNHPGQACLDFERPRMKDPYSARLARFDVKEFGSISQQVTIEYHAKNGFGAYVPGSATCIVRDGVVDGRGTDIVRDSKAISDRNEELNRNIECLEKQADDIIKGVPQRACKVP